MIERKKMGKTETLIDRAPHHTIKKFELIERYVQSWAHKLLQNENCKGIVFVDCMSNSGQYVDDYNNPVYGTPVRVAKYLRDISGQYQNKKISLYFSDLSEDKTDHLKTLMPKEKSNYHYYITAEDGNDLLKRLAQNYRQADNYHYLIIYDPFQARIDWESIVPFLNGWSEVIINHMVSDSIRAVKMAKKYEAKQKYQQTYLSDFEDLLPYGSNKDAFEARVEEIICSLRKNRYRSLYIATFPFFNEKNALVYNLIHCTANITGFNLFKESAWKTFGGKSSTKNTHGLEKQYMLDFDNNELKSYTDNTCYYVKDIADYLWNLFRGKENIPLSDVWGVLELHPVFPSSGFRNEIKNELKLVYGARITRSHISFTKKENYEN